MSLLFFPYSKKSEAGSSRLVQWLHVVINKPIALPSFLTQHYIFFSFKNTSLCRAVLGSQQNWKKVQRFLIYFLHPYHTASPTINTASMGVVHLLPRMELKRHIIITQTPQFTLRFTQCCISMSFDKCIVMHIYPLNTYYFIDLKSSVFCPLIPPLPKKPLIFHHLHSFVFSRMSHNWNQTVCSLFRLTSFT